MESIIYRWQYGVKNKWRVICPGQTLHYGDLLIHYDNSSVRDKLYFLRYVDLHQRALAPLEVLLEGSTDSYLTLRESALQRRRFLIYDGDPPVDDDFYDEFLDEEFMDEEFMDEER